MQRGRGREGEQQERWTRWCLGMLSQRDPGDGVTARNSGMCCRMRYKGRGMRKLSLDPMSTMLEKSVHSVCSTAYRVVLVCYCRSVGGSSRLKIHARASSGGKKLEVTLFAAQDQRENPSWEVFVHRYSLWEKRLVVLPFRVYPIILSAF